MYAFTSSPSVSTSSPAENRKSVPCRYFVTTTIKLSAALNQLCVLRLKAKEYDAAIAGCSNASVKAKRIRQNLDSRGMAWLVELRPNSAWSLYGLSIAEAHK